MTSHGVPVFEAVPPPRVSLFLWPLMSRHTL